MEKKRKQILDTPHKSSLNRFDLDLMVSTVKRSK